MVKNKRTNFISPHACIFMYGTLLRFRFAGTKPPCGSAGPRKCPTMKPYFFLESQKNLKVLALSRTLLKSLSPLPAWLFTFPFTGKCIISQSGQHGSYTTKPLFQPHLLYCIVYICHMLKLCLFQRRHDFLFWIICFVVLF